MSLDDKVLGSNEATRTYKIEDGEPSSVLRQVWNGDVFDYQRDLLNKIANERDHKARFKMLIECAKISLIAKQEFEKANFYKQEFESMASYLNNIGCLHETKVTDKVKDQHGKEHNHEYSSKRSIAKSIPSLRGVVSL